MTDWLITRHQVAIAGRITNAETGKPIAGVPVSIVGPPVFGRKLQLLGQAQGAPSGIFVAKPDQTESRNDGLFYFLDLPDGKYTVKASVPNQGTRFAGAQQSVTVSRDAKGNMKLASANLAMQPTTVRGKVTGPAHKTGVPMARVYVKGSGESAFTDAQGQYLLTGIESGKRTVVVAAQGYKTKLQQVTLAKPGIAQTEDIPLMRETG